MNLEDLKVFLAVAEASGVTRAAPYLGRVPSNVSTRVAHLERTFGVPLFLRSNSGMSLTREGEVLRTHAYRLLRAYDNTVGALKGPEHPSLLRVGISSCVASLRVNEILAGFASQYPGCELRLEHGSTRELQAKLLAGELDGAFCDATTELEGLRSVVLESEIVVVAGRRGWNGKP
ncbi:LysR family transcriptional regulator, partial [Streptococcus pyogenes]|uniref:LysR family transcriptional regulator n=1 Tax=Streptococcus pyogenes TaxID=1314 RepID=UPI003D9FB562